MTKADPQIGLALGEAIARRVGEPRYRFWFADKTRFADDAGQLRVGVPNCFYQDFLAKKFGDDVRAAAAEVFGAPVTVRFAIDPELFQAARRDEAEQLRAPNAERGTRNAERGTPENAAPAAREPEPLPPPPAPRSELRAPRSRHWHRLADFVVGACNRLAHAAALSVVEEPAQHANPLVLHGPVGTGKTHLLEGIYAGLRKQHPEWRVTYITAEEFTNRFVQAMHHGKLAAFRKFFRESDVLLVDDLHFLAGKHATQDEFLHTFDVLHGDDKQVIVSCDCHPRLADEFGPELTDRLLGGAVWGLTPPDAATRLDILRARAAGGDPAVPEPVLQFLAEQLRGNVRELEGALHSLRHYSRVTARPVDVSLAREALADLLRHAVRVVRLADVEQAVCKILRVDSGALRGKQRAWAVSHPRMLAVYLSRRHTSSAYSEIGQHFGGRNHSTAVAAEKKVRQWLKEDGELVLGEQRLKVREVVERIERELQR